MSLADINDKAAFSIVTTSSELGISSLVKVGSIVSGRLSTQKYPKSSKALVAELIPEPLNPVRITRRDELFFQLHLMT
jgi:hypothetical protein